jgi:hypothetical protein
MLGIPQRFTLDDAELDRRQRELFAQHQSGPQASDARALELINDAVAILRDPVSRAEELFRMRGWATRGSPDPILLERIFTDREFIDNARKRGDVQALHAWIEAARPRQQALLGKLTLLLDSDTDAAAVAPESTGGRAERALLIFEELRYFVRAIAAANAAVTELEALEMSEP